MIQNGRCEVNIDTCDECDNYDIFNGMCQANKILRKSCGESACTQFKIALDLIKYTNESGRAEMEADAECDKRREDAMKRSEG
jgi:hypothetical protein